VLVAHGGLKSSNPRGGARLDRAPTELVLDFTEASPLSVTRARLVGADSVPVALGALAHVAGSGERSVRAAITGPLAAGTYAVEWQTAGADGHPVRGRFTFVVLPGAAGLPAPTPEPPPASVNEPARAPSVSTPAMDPDAASTFDAESPAYVLIRFATFAALVALLGAVVFATGVLAAIDRNARDAVPRTVQTLATRRALRVAQIAVGTLALAALARLAAQSYALFGAEAFEVASLGAVLGTTLWGKGWLLQAAGVVLAAAALRALRRDRSFGWPMLAAAALALAMTPGLSGHAASVPGKAALAVLADTLHVVSAGGWIGTLLLLVAAGIPAAWTLDEGARELAVATLVRAFSPIALVFTVVLALTGGLAAWLHLEAVAALWQTPYGRTLLLKLAILSAVAGTGWYNWKKVTPRLETSAGVALLRRTAAIELGTAVLVLLVTAVLVATPPTPTGPM